MTQEYNKYEDCYYSSYQTEDKKYEYRTGPFEGLFVSSVEFCKHVKFDYRKDNNSRDNRTGTQGPQGPAGPKGDTGANGATGATGATGPNQILAGTLYYNPGNVVTIFETGVFIFYPNNRYLL